MRNSVLSVILLMTGAPSALLAQTASETEQNRKVETSFHVHWYVVKDGEITDHFASRDDLGMTQQLGLLPSPPAAGVANQ
jgi:hypothetical protein